METKEKRGLKGEIKASCIVEVSDILFPITLMNAHHAANAFEIAKENMLHELKKVVANMKVEDIKMTEIVIPDFSFSYQEDKRD